MGHILPLFTTLYGVHFFSPVYHKYSKYSTSLYEETTGVLIEYDVYVDDVFIMMCLKHAVREAFWLADEQFGSAQWVWASASFELKNTDNVTFSTFSSLCSESSEQKKVSMEMWGNAPERKGMTELISTNERETDEEWKMSLNISPPPFKATSSADYRWREWGHSDTVRGDLWQKEGWKTVRLVMMYVKMVVL